MENTFIILNVKYKISSVGVNAITVFSCRGDEADYAAFSTSKTTRFYFRNENLEVTNSERRRRLFTFIRNDKNSLTSM